MSIRLRLTLWYTTILVVTLSAFAVVIFVGLERLWQNNLDTTVQGRAQEAGQQISVLFALSSSGTAAAFAAGPDQEQLDTLAQGDIYIQYVDINGVVKQRSRNLLTALPISPDDTQAIRRGQSGYRTLSTAEGDNLRAYLLVLRLPNGQPYAAVMTAGSTAPLLAALRRAQLFLAGGTLAATLLLALIVYAVARAGLRPISRMARDAAGIQEAQDLSRRVAVPRTHDEVAELGVTFNGMLGRLEAAFAAQRRFIADASHELRTPLTAIRGNADLLRQHGARMTDADRDEVLAEVTTEAERMTRLINDLLALARVQAGEQPQPQPLRLNDIAESAVRGARGLARGHEIIYAAANEYLWVLGDADRLKQLALILLDNAIKYTPPEGCIWVALRRDGAHAELRVTDNGPGIPPERLPHLFDRFYRGGTLARGRDDGGAGLGLAIAREITQGFGGSIAVESTAGRGTAFTVTFPLLTATPVPPASEYPAPADAPISPAPAPVAAARATHQGEAG